MAALKKHIAYFVHDLTDAAVHRRTRMLMLGGARVTVIGFRRSDNVYEKVEGAKVVDLGRTYDAKLGRRVYEVAKATASFRAHLTAIADADGLSAESRNAGCGGSGKNASSKRSTHHLRMFGRSSTSSFQQPHWTMHTGARSPLCTRADLLITSSPAFITQYFRKFEKINLPIELVENKVLANSAMTTNAAVREATPLG